MHGNGLEGLYDVFGHSEENTDESESRSVMSDSDSVDYAVHGILQARILEWVAFPLSQGPSQPTDGTQASPSSPAEPQGKPKNAGVGSLSLLQWIFPSQESSWALLHCRVILYQLRLSRKPSTLMGI